ncbi:MAG: ATP-binding protein, partial [Candidatus Eisenbacteria bacterium]|nr:ATP-binding protein [Candidatus Eisenbacteria bacterium]
YTALSRGLGDVYKRQVDVEASADLAEWEGRQGVQVVLRDVTERKLAAQRKEQAELRLRRAAAQRLRLAQVSTTVVAQTSVEGLLSEVATAARDLISARWAVSSLGESAESLRLGAVATASGVEERDASILFRPDADGIACRAKLLRARSCRLQCAVTEGRSDADAGGNEPARTGGDAAATTGGDGSSTTGPPAPATREVVAARLESANGSVRGLLVACGKFEGEDEAAPDPGGMTEEDESLLVQLASIASLALQHIEARSEAERAGRMKDEFLATLSHELRTPLSVILGWAQMLSSGRLHDDEAREAIRTIERNACNQKELIEELLDMSRIISGKVHLDLQLVDPSEVALQAAASILPSIEAKGLRLTQSIDPAAGRVFGDPDRLQQVLGNLLTNAVKFTPEGGEVRLDVFAQNDQVCFVVSDSGVGIRQESLLAIFERFRQQDSSTTRKYKGLGLGLSIAKQLVALQEGTIEAWSEGEGKGATFTVRMQRVAPEGERPAPRTESSREPSDEQLEAASRSLAGIRVLVVEDEMEAARLIALWMREAGAEAHMASSVAAALDLLVSGRYDLIVSDIGMPDQDGYDLIRAVRSSSDAAIARIPAVALTAFARHEDRERARKAGFQHHLAKPVDPQELLAIAARLCDAAKPARPSQRSIA